MKGKWNKSLEVKFNRFIERTCMSDEVLKHTNMTIERIMELCYGGVPVNIRYDPYLRAYICDVIKYTADPAHLTEKDGIFTTERNSL